MTLIESSASNMRQYFERIENNHYVPLGTPGHGFNGFLDICLNDDEELKNQTQSQIVLEATAKAFGQDPSKIFDLIQADVNNDSPNRDEQTGVFGFPAHRDPQGRRVSARNAVVDVSNATNPNGSKKYNLTVGFNSLVAKVLFDTAGENVKTPQAIGVEYLAGKSMYSADPRYNASLNGTTMQAYARKEVILSGGVFNTPQILKLSGIGPKDELEKFDIPVLVDLLGVGHNMQDNNEFGLMQDASEDL
jgi:choline dehydrogenase